MSTRNVTLTDHFDSFIDSGIAAGRFSDASEAVRVALQLLEQHDAEEHAKIKWLRDAAHEGIDSLDRGEGKSFASMDLMADHIRHLGRKASGGASVGKQSA